MRVNGKINVQLFERKMPPEVTLDSFFPAILRFGFVVCAPIQVVTNNKWQFVSI